MRTDLRFRLERRRRRLSTSRPPVVRDIPGLGSPGVAGHAGRLAWAEPAGVETFVFQGRRHWYEGEGWKPVACPLYMLKQMGAGPWS